MPRGDGLKDVRQLSPIKRALLAVERAEARVRALEEARREPVAIVGAACRLPGGVDSPAAFWEVLQAGREAVGDVPPSRWRNEEFYDPDPDAPGKLYCTRGGFLSEVDRFDAAFFGISPREARSLDPQQRLLLEVAWHALEDALQAPDTLAGSRTGVYIGATTNDYAQLLQERGPVDTYFFTGNPLNTLAGRLAYALGLEGPSLVLDTACSSSLVALHQACQALRARECDAALAGGVNLLLRPETTIAVCRTRALAPDGRCKPFAEGADGFVRSEGCGVLFLKRLSDALAAGDPIRAVIRSSAVNQDGASSGFTAPNGRAQRGVIRAALGDLEPGGVQYVEAHGTGTALGDPIEIGALAEVYGTGRLPAEALGVGSVKSNLGHCEAAAGVASVLKVMLALERGHLPPSLHCERPSTLIPWEGSGVRVVTRLEAWPAPPAGSPRRAGVSGFGASGTNAHLILEAAPGGNWPDPAARPELLCLSARSPSALQALGEATRRLLRDGAPEWSELAAAAARGRSQLPHRLTVLASSGKEAAEALTEQLEGRSHPSCRRSQGRPARPRVAFLFPGQGAQYCGMGRELYAGVPRFRQVLDRCAAVFDSVLERPLLEVLFAEDGPEARARLSDTAYCQSALFSVEVALAELLRGMGVEPVVLLGHSLGELSAAYVAGCAPLEDLARLVAQRGRLMGSLPRGGAMQVVLAEEALVRRTVQACGGEVDIAVLNAAGNVVISGPDAAVARVAARLAETGTRCRRLNTSHAFHSRLMDPILAELHGAAAELSFAPPGVPLVSNLDGGLLESAPGPRHWRDHCRNAVRFAACARTLADQGPDLILELGPGRTLSSLVALAAEDGPPAFPVLGRGGRERETLLRAIAELVHRGQRIDWSGLLEPRRPVALPSYPFERERHWAPEQSMNQDPGPRAPGPSSPGPSSGTSSAGPAAPASAATPAPDGPARLAEVQRELAGALAGALETPVERLDPHTPFLELGADSLVLVEAMRLIQDRFGVSVAMSQLFGELSTLESLAAHVAAHLAPPAPAAPTPAAPALPALPSASGAPVTTASVERLLSEQTRAMSELLQRQLDFLRETAGLPPAAAPAPAGPSRPAPSLAGAPSAGAPSAGAPSAGAPSAGALSAGAPSAGAPSTGAPSAGPQPARRQKPPPPWGRGADLRRRGLSPEQSAHLDELTARFCARTQGSKRLAEASRACLADSRASVGFRFTTKDMLYPIAGARAEGSRLWDTDGNEYVDFTMGFGVHLFGHRPPFIQEAVAAALASNPELGARSPLAGEVAEQLTRLTGLDRVAFCNSGTEAVMAAVRLARARTGRNLVAVFEHAYHGHADTTLARPGPGGRGLPAAPGVPPGVAENIVVLDYAAPAALAALEALGPQLAAILIEPVQSRDPLLQPRAFVGELRRICSDHGAALIIDEMITGFRVHPGGAQADFGVRADLATYGKIVGGGLPIGVVAGSAEFMDGIDGGAWSYGDGSFPRAERTAFGGTFCQHPLSLAAARATLQELEERGAELLERLNARTAVLAAELEAVFAERGLAVRVPHYGSMFRFEFSGNLELLYYHLLLRGIYIWEWRTCFLSSAHDEDDLRRFVTAVDESVAALQAGGFLTPEPPAPREVPLSEAQRQLWLLAQVDARASCAYNTSMCLELRGAPDAETLRVCLTTLANRHEALRATVLPGGERLRIAPRWAGQVAVVRRPEADAEEEQQLLRTWCERVAGDPFQLESGPLFRAAVLQVGAQRLLVILAAHHLIVDGWSMGLLMDELGALVDAAQRGRRAQLPEPVTLERYDAWLHDPARGAELAEQRRYWRAQLADGLPPLELPGTGSRAALRTWRGGRTVRRLDGARVAQLEAMARAHSATPFIVFQALWALLLHRLSGQDRVACGVPVTGRGLPDGTRLVNYCTHLLPLVSSIADDPSWEDFLQRRRTALLAAFDRQELPFAEMVGWLRAGRDLTSAPPLQSFFNLEPLPAIRGFGGAAVELVASPIEFSEFDLALNLVKSPAGLVADCQWSADLFDAPGVERILDAYEQLMADVAARPGEPVRSLALLGARERQVIVEDWNDSGPAHPLPAPVQETVFRQAARTPDALAVVAHRRGQAPQRVSYARLARSVHGVARALRAAGVRADGIVGVCLRRGATSVVAFLAALEAQAAYLPLDPQLPETRLGMMLADTGCAAVLTDRACAGSLPPTEVPVLFIEDLLDAADAAPLGLAVHPDQLAYVLFTSGSTGRPKGVGIPHRGMRDIIGWALATYTPEDLALTCASGAFSFDSSVVELFAPLCCGGTVLLLEDPLHLLEVADRPTWMSTVPSAAGALLAAGAIPASLRRLCLAGEPLPPELAEKLYSCTPLPQLENLYGATEDSVYSTRKVVPRRHQEVMTIGRPVSGRRCYLLDALAQPVPVSVVAEVVVAGAGVARGYLARPGLSAARFVPDPAAPGQRAYRTGDLGRHRPDGEIEVLGRMDHQIKLRGFRIELGEIESVLSRCAGVREAAVVVRAAPGGDRRLVAYLVPDSPAGVREVELREQLAGQLPRYMLPSAYLTLPDMPRTANGKLDRKALPPLEPAASAAADAGREPAPQDGPVARVARVLAQVLGVPELGPSDDFFALGGHSLLALDAALKLEEALGVELTLGDVFDQPTAAGLAELARRRGATDAEIPRIPDAPDYALSPLQRAFWARDGLQATDLPNCDPLALEIVGPLCRDRLGTAVAALVRRHEILRSVFPAVDGEPRQRVLPPDAGGPRLELADLSARPDGEAALRETFAHAARRLDIAQAPPVRFVLAALSPTRHVLIAAIHHIANDGFSELVLKRELSAAYERLRLPGAPEPAPLRLQYRDYAAWLNAKLSGEEGARLRAYWQTQLSGLAPPPVLARDVAPLAATAPRPEVHAFVVAEATVAALETSARRADCTLFMMLHAACAAFLARHTGCEDLAIASPSAGREQPGLADQLGPYLNVLPLRHRVNPGEHVLDLLPRVRETTLAAWAHQHYPVQAMVRDQGLAGGGASPLFNLGLTLQTQEQLAGARLFPHLEVRPLPELVPARRGAEAATDLWFLGERRPGRGLELDLVFDAARLRRETAARIATSFSRCLELVVESPHLPIARYELPPLTAAAPVGRVAVELDF